jgi:hypothetical protein
MQATEDLDVVPDNRTPKVLLLLLHSSPPTPCPLPAGASIFSEGEPLPLNDPAALTILQIFRLINFDIDIPIYTMIYNTSVYLVQSSNTPSCSSTWGMQLKYQHV